MNTKDLEYFYRLSELKSFTEVARDFGVSQPTITYAIKRLEEQFSCSLIEKTPANRVMNLTRQGEIVAGHAREILLEFSRLEKDLERERQGKIHLGFPPIISTDIFANLHRSLPDVDFFKRMTLIRQGSNDLWAMLLSGDLDFSLIGSFERLSHPDLIVEILYEREFYFILPPEHPLAGAESLSLQDLLDENFILLDEHHIHLTAFERLNGKYQHQAEVALTLDDFVLIGQMIREQMGIGFLTDVALMNEFTDLVKIPLAKEDRIPFYISYAYPRTAILREELLEFKEVLLDLKNVD